MSILFINFFILSFIVCVNCCRAFTGQSANSAWSAFLVGVTQTKKGAAKGAAMKATGFSEGVKKFGLDDPKVKVRMSTIGTTKDFLFCNRSRCYE